MKTNVAHDPIQIGSLGMNRVAVKAENLSDLIEKFWLLTSCRASHIVSSVNDALKVVITGIGQNCPKSSLISHDQGEMASESMVRPPLNIRGRGIVGNTTRPRELARYDSHREVYEETNCMDDLVRAVCQLLRNLIKRG